MFTMILGMILWIDSHLFKRILPDVRDRLGDKSKLFVALGSLAGLILMVIGYRMADGPVYWNRSPMLAGINNLLMLISVYLSAAAGMKLRITRSIRHPMLVAVVIWAVAHLLVNGDLESIVLFGGMLLWAEASMHLINRAEKTWTKPEPKAAKKEVIGVVAAVVVYAAIIGVHLMFGLAVFG